MMMKNNKFLIKLVCFLVLAVILTGCIKKVPSKKASLPPQTVVEGKIACHNKENVLKDAYIYVYKDASTDFKDSPFLISGPTNEDGEYSITLPNGRYYFVARKFLGSNPKTLDLEMQAGEYYCYYGGNPLPIFNSGKPIFLGFNCSQIIKKETVEPKPIVNETGGLTNQVKKMGVKGTVTYNVNPVSGAYILVYQNTVSNFRGPVFRRSLPTDANGNFKVDLPPGEYYILAKKKRNTDPEKFRDAFPKGKDPMGNIVAGPLSQGDYFSYYPNNPITVTDGSYVNINMPVINKLSSDDISYNNYLSPTRIEGIVNDLKGEPISGVRVFASKGKMLMLMSEKPTFISSATKKDGKYIINFTEEGVFYLGARDFVGRAPKMGEYFGYYFGTEDHSILINENNIVKDVEIKVWKIE